MKALNHEEPDRVPLDLGGTFASTINYEAYDRLKDYLGVETPTIIASERSLIAQVEEPVLKRFDIDTRGLTAGNPERRPGAKNPDGSYEDEWGVVRRRPAEGHYMQVGAPLQDASDLADLRGYDWPDPDDPGLTRYLSAAARTLHGGTDYAVVLSLPVGVVHQTQFLCGYVKWMTDILLNTAFMDALFEKVTEIWLRIADNLLAAAGNDIDIVFFGDDIAFQNGPMISLDDYRRRIRPWHDKIFRRLKDRMPAGAKLMYHSCGSVYLLIDQLIDMGVDVLNPIQQSAKDMDSRKLKREFGDRLAFWGGIDTHHVLPFGSTENVREEVRRRIDELAPGGGYVLNTVHNIQKDVPPQNICAMFEAALDFGGY
jgi:uroporphyrinogen decarboxylase